MPELPPPPPPPPGHASAAEPEQSTHDRPFPDDRVDTVRTWLIAWFGPLRDPRRWRAVLYLAFGVLTGTVLGSLVLAFGVIAFALLFALIGFVLVRPVFAVAEAFCDVERHLAGWVGRSIPARPVQPLHGLGLAALGDAERWRQVGFLVLNITMSVVIAMLGLVGFVSGFGLIFADQTGQWTLFGAVTWVIRAALGFIVLGAAPRVATFVAELKADMTAWFLGPDQLAAATERAARLSIQRDDVLEAVAAERRRIERNLHDGVQQQLVAIGLDLGMAEASIDNDPRKAAHLISEARSKVRSSIGELRQLGRGLHPAILGDRGLDAALSAIVASSAIPIDVELDASLDPTRDQSETIYFIINEAVANVMKHARATGATVEVARIGANVRVRVADDGEGGANLTAGTGLAGIRARVLALDGVFTLTSPPGGPTQIVAEFPYHAATPPPPPPDLIGQPAHQRLEAGT